MLEQLSFAAVLLAGIIAAYTDWKTGYIYDWITYPLIAIGIILSALTQQWLGILLGVAIYGIGLLVYRTGKIGGGDIKLLAGMALVQPVFAGMIFVFAVLFVAALTACLGLSVYYVGNFLLTKPKIAWKTQRKMSAGIMLLGVLVLGWLNVQNPLWSIETTLFIGVSLFAGILFYAFEEEIKRHAFLKRIPLEQLEDDEVLAMEHLTAEEKQKMEKNISALVGTDDTLKLKQLGFHTIPVYRNLPKFAPFLLLGTLITYLFPQWVSQFVPVLF